MFITELLYERNQLQLVVNHHLEKLSARDNPPGILLCQKHKTGFRWQHKYLRDGHPITVSLSKTRRPFAEKLAVNLYRIISIDYLQKQIASIDSLISSLQSEACSIKLPDSQQADLITESPLYLLLHKVRTCPHVPADFFKPSSPYRLLILSHLEKEYAWIIDWYLRDYKQNPEHPENLQYPVKLGFKVRSKSEVLEADRLFEEGILFHYEELMLMSNEEAYPDFYIPITIIEQYAWEHFGAMDKEGYFYRTKGKINTYLDHKWLTGINMLTTYETRQHPLTEEQVNQNIRWLKNRYRLAFPDLPPDESFNLYDLAAFVRSHRIGQ